MRKYIIVQTQFEGYHKWDEAPDEVYFLRNEHRHMFKVVLTIAVKHEDRELEFFMIQKELNNLIEVLFDPKNHLVGSCEMIAEEILENFVDEYDREIQVEVWEDGENGALVMV